MKIAVVDDNPNDANHLLEALSSYEKWEDGKPEIEVFPRGIKFLDQFKQLFDVVFMDIDMPVMDGLEVSKKLNALFGDVVHAYPNRCSVDVTPKGISKEQGIRKLIDLMGWAEPEVFSIGDEINDLPMIEAFNGFTVDTAREAIQAKARKVYQGVGMMLEANL